MKQRIVVLIFAALLTLTACTSQSNNSAVKVEETPAQKAAATPKTFDADDVPLQYVGDISTCFSYIGHDSYFDVLIVQFESSGSVYAYFDFDADAFSEFEAASSLGEYYNEYIKNNYDYERIR